MRCESWLCEPRDSIALGVERRTMLFIGCRLGLVRAICARRVRAQLSASSAWLRLPHVRCADLAASPGSSGQLARACAGRGKLRSRSMATRQAWAAMARLRPASGRLRQNKPFFMQRLAKRAFACVDFGHGKDLRLSVRPPRGNPALAKRSSQFDVNLRRTQLRAQSADCRRARPCGRKPQTRSGPITDASASLGRSVLPLPTRHAPSAGAIGQPGGKDLVRHCGIHDQGRDRGNPAIAEPSQRPASVQPSVTVQPLANKCTNGARVAANASLMQAVGPWRCGRLDEAHFVLQIVRIGIRLVESDENLAVGRPVFQDGNQRAFQAIRCCPPPR